VKELMMNKVGSYANAIIAFIVLQGIAYSYYFGSNETFNCLVHVSYYLPEALSILFFIVMVLALFAVKVLGKIEAELAPEYEEILAKLSKGKMLVVLIFGSLPCFLTLFYGVFGRTPSFCL
jgi:hypothetical protein